MLQRQTGEERPAGVASRFRILLDSASLDDARAASDLRFVSAITTNPTLLARHDRPPLVQLQGLLAVFPGPIFFQPAAPDVTAARQQLEEALRLAPERVLPKLVSRADFVALASRFVDEGHTVAVTAVYSAGQALLAAAAGARWVIPYVNRAKRFADDGDRLVRDIASVLRSARSTTEILAASIKSPAEALKAVADGAHSVSAPLEVLLGLARHPLTDSAIEDFARDASTHEPPAPGDA